jgi:predicted transcriptional regulator
MKLSFRLISVDNLEVAQFIYLLLNNQKIRHVIDTITSKVVLILGRFTPQRKAVLDAIRDELRKRDYLPLLFDFDKPSNRDITETVSTLAHMAKFVIADITDARSIPQELMAIVRRCRPCRSSRSCWLHSGSTECLNTSRDSRGC